MALLLISIAVLSLYTLLAWVTSLVKGRKAPKLERQLEEGRAAALRRRRLIRNIALAATILVLWLTIGTPDFADPPASQAAERMGDDLKELWLAQEVYWQEHSAYASSLSSLESWSPREVGYKVRVSDDGSSWLGTSATFVGRSRKVRCRVFGGRAVWDFPFPAGVHECREGSRLCGLLCLPPFDVMKE